MKEVECVDDAFVYPMPRSRTDSVCGRSTFHGEACVHWCEQDGSRRRQMQAETLRKRFSTRFTDTRGWRQVKLRTLKNQV